MRAAMEIGHRRSRSSAPPTSSRPSAPAGSAWSRSRAAPARRPPAPRRSRAAWWCTPRPTRCKRLRKGVMELYISDHPLDCLTCAANGDCELQDMAGAVGLREVRYGYDGAQPSQSRRRTTSNPYFTFDPVEVHRLLALRARLRGGAGHLRADHRRPRLRLASSSPGRTRPFLDSECVSCGACVQACPTATLIEKSVIEIGQPEHSVVTTCAYCGVGCTLQGRDARRRAGAHGALQGRQGQPRPFLRQGPLRLGLCHPPRPHPQADDPRQDHRSLARGDAGTRRSATPPPSSSASRRNTASGSIGGITSSRCTNEETFLVQKLVRAGFGNNNVDTCARVCHSPTGYGLKTTFGTSAGTQDFDSVEHADVIMVIGANPTDAHPVFASRMKKRLREGAKLIVIDPRRIDLVRIAACRGGLSPAAAARHQRRRCSTALAHVIVTEGLVDEEFVRERCDWDEFQRLGGLRRRAAATARRRSRSSPACRPRRSAARRGSTPPAATARSITASASPSTARARPR